MKRMNLDPITIVVVVAILFAACSVASQRKAQAKDEPNPAQVDIGAMAQVESGDDPNAVGPCGEHGCCQIMQATWDECVDRLGRTDWIWETRSFDQYANKTVAGYYVNVRIPQMLRYYGVPDTLEVRLASYNWGIGKVRRLWRKDGTLDNLPQSVKKYIERYQKALLEQDK